MKFYLDYAPGATKDLAGLSDQIRTMIVKKLETYFQQDNPLAFAKPLQGDFKGFYRFRIGDYRAVFRKKADGTITIILILRVQHRKDIYE
ncbi:hypothetical protein A3C09_01605 [Candidatus Uhrbacteria bacterium RIFCSPHIGHO2_02_FULL_47_44]|uniref:Addiction module toxin RelE n=1 Tax=Candidatus Uhrbacteria bacterium RIFCSPLOWO2_02_FULL_48_18 TaxID=1802408 RepID=A0A1F7V8Z9_9BACT|nr:MAG: hypothetical protein A2839_02490 [Candidatus Uhrbacteria bacterium RIFCSPHIGHO2_01_FULL_47_10]OGL69857.1 MAG: hypothetical protein A3C09_01605 [Candidatus Uhrbacteria bacterium RIFCSPHIGHO2_02_FULL_47_44]OGL77477.1 MAG: hypothetical protein A3E97_00665 [Candidatus Uhrbacteria bacterium RIFCSPHIGHO2_12_FULL_47_12]OGL81839.1 MAG: hypothetical protein A3B20_01970 [Candidatus Uhrbacteria bacterium RIFCSPLOWO2_01_FULL_47_17]OGL87002.1 MAG: hypothetical protein A3I41_03560 [Candidatus Uhrbact